MDKDFKEGDQVIWGVLHGSVVSGPFHVRELGTAPVFLVDFNNARPELLHTSNLEPVEKWESVDVPLGEIRWKYIKASTGVDWNDEAQGVIELQVRVR